MRYSENAWYAIPATFSVLWLAFLLNLTGLRAGKWAGVLGGGSTYVIAAMLVAFAVLVTWRYGSATRLSVHS